jgi:hypothetical protein
VSVRNYSFWAYVLVYTGLDTRRVGETGGTGKHVVVNSRNARLGNTSVSKIWCSIYSIRNIIHGCYVLQNKRRLKWQEVGENCVMRSCMVCTQHQILLEWSNKWVWNRRSMQCAWGRRKCLQHFGWEAWRKEITGKTEAYMGGYY